MMRWTNTGMMYWRITTVFAIIFLAALMQGSAGAENTTSGQWLSLNVYLDNTGKALVTGYAENVSGLDFLNTSQFRFENDTRLLYALTDGLTTKAGDLWTLRFDARGSFDDYRVTFFLPSDMRLGMINASTGLGYLLSASNESLVADVQGYEVSNPAIVIQYQQPLAASGSLPDAMPPGDSGNNSRIIMLLAASLLVAVLALAIVMGRRKNESLPNSSAPADRGVAGLEATPFPGRPGKTEPLDSSKDPQDAISIPNESATFEPQAEDDGVYRPEAASSPEDRPGSIEPSTEPSLYPTREGSSPGEPGEVLPSDAEIAKEESDGSVPELEDAAKNGIVISSEMEAVMQTLTAREQAVMTTLIDHGGRMTQAEIRYETRTPKSSLTGILISLERRKLITKKEWGRTNIIELSSWFLSKKERL
jgi:uncharacterized membrane protein